MRNTESSDFMSDREKKLYVLRSGDKPGIFLEWLEFFEKIDGRDDVECRMVPYKEELAEAGENVRFSLKWAYKLAHAFLAGEDIDGRLRGEELVEEASRENEQVEQKASQPKQEPIEEANKAGQPEQKVSRAECMEEQGAETQAESEETKKAAELSEILHEKLWIAPELRKGTPWLDMLLQLTEMKTTKFSCDTRLLDSDAYTGRYFASTLYVLMFYLILDMDEILNEILDERNRTNKRQMTPYEKEEWIKCIKYEFHRSMEYVELATRFADMGLKKMDLEEMRRRNVAAVRHLVLVNKSESYLRIRDFLKTGQHTVVDLYEELTKNPIHREEIMRVAWSVENPDLVEGEKEEPVSTLEQLVGQAKEVRAALENVVVGQDAAIDKLVRAHFYNEKQGNGVELDGPRSAYLFAGPPGVGKTYMAELFAKALKIPYRRFDMSAYASINSMEEVIGISSFYRNSKPGVLTSYVQNNPECVLLFDEIEKAHIDVIRLFLQILDEGVCFDRYLDKNISFKNCIIIMTTNAGKQLYAEVGNENLTELPDRVVIDAFEKDMNQVTGKPYFPPEIVSRMASHTMIMFNHLKADAIRKVIKKDVEGVIRENKNKYQFDLSKGSEVVAATVQFAVGGGGDARNASKLGSKLVDQELYELFTLASEKHGDAAGAKLKKVSWECDFTDCSEEIRTFYQGEKGCIVPILKSVDKPYETTVASQLLVKVVNNQEAFLEMVRKEKVLFAVIDYAYGLKPEEKSISIADTKTIGSRVLAELRKENAEIPVYLLKNDMAYRYSEREKQTLLKNGAEGFIEETALTSQLAQAYIEICCKNAMEILTLRNQVMTYATRKELNENGTAAKIIFYKMKLETAVEAEDKGLLVSDELRPDKKWSDIYVSKHIRDELEFFVNYLINPKEYIRTGARTPRGALMFGPPGTGKTSLAKVVAAESKVNFLSVSADVLMNGGAEKVHDMFRVARKYAPAVLFIDEIDAIGISRNRTGANATLNALLTEMDGFTREESKPVFVMAATNLKGIDGALARRFDRTFVVDLPDENGRRWLLKRLLRIHGEKFQISEKEIDSIAMRSRGMSPADLENVIETALREGIRNCVVICDAMLDEVFERCNYGEKREVSSEKEVEHTAFHEAGHAMIELHYGRCPEYMSVVARDNFGGYVQPEQMKEHPTKERLLQRICMSMGGRAAELEFGYGLTPGAAGDLATATKLAVRMVCELGMYEEEIGLAVIGEEEYQSHKEAKTLVNQILKEQLVCARQIINENRECVVRLVETVMQSEQKYLTKKDIMEAYKR